MKTMAAKNPITALKMGSPLGKWGDKRRARKAAKGLYKPKKSKCKGGSCPAW